MTRDGSRSYGPATTRIFRIMVLAVGPAAIVFGALVAPEIVARFSVTAQWWSLPTLAVTLGIPVLASAVSWRASVRTLRLLMGITAIGYALAMLTLPAALGGTEIPDAGSPWLFGLTAIGTSASAIAWRPRFAWPYVVLICVLTAVDRIVAVDFSVAAMAGEDALYSLMFCSVFAGLAMVSIRAGRTVDAATTAARADAAQAAAARARTSEATRIDGLVHDTVLATLLVAARGSAEHTATAVSGAQRALAQLEWLRSADPTSGTVHGNDLVWRVQSTTTDLAPETQFSYEADGCLEVPAAVSAALAEATAEAVRNSVRHAEGSDARGRQAHPVTRAVHVRVQSALIEVTILDDGVGFDLADVDRGRLGIAVSIRGRMSSIAGGRAVVVSRVGMGTRVLLQWRPS